MHTSSCNACITNWGSSESLKLHVCVLPQPRRSRASLAQSLRESSSDEDEAESVASEDTAPPTEDSDDEDYS